MVRFSLPMVLACLLVGCDRPPLPSADALAADPARLHALRMQCLQGEYDGVFCAAVDRAELRRFLSGRSGADEYRTLAELPSIPPSFDGPTAPETQP